MALRGTTALLAVLVAVSSAGWNIYTSVQATDLPFPWIPAMVGLLPHVAAVAAVVLVLRGGPWWRRAGLTYLGAFTALEALGLVQIVPFASQFRVGVLWWSVATAALAVVAAALTMVALRDGRVEPDGGVSRPLRWAAVLAGLLIVASSTLAWSVSAHAPAGRLTFSLAHASPGVWIGTIVGMVVIAGITVVVATSSERPLVVGAAAGLLASRPLALGVLADTTRQDADVVLAAGWWLALAAQVLLVVALVGILVRDGGRGARDAPDLVTTRT